MHKPAALFLCVMLFIPLIFLINLTPLSVLWLLLYVFVIYWFTRKANKEKTYVKGASIIYLGAAVAVIGKKCVALYSVSGDVSSEELVIETFFQVMLMVSSGLGGGLLAHYFINERKA